jgi:nicotinate-nucleotide adenylyltransferase
LIKKNKKKFNKIGILGGSFDPPHIGHLNISKIAIRKLRLTKLIWIVTQRNPLKKKPYLNVAMRIKLSKSITKNNKKILVKYLDNEVRSSYTFNLLNHLKKYNKKNMLFFLIGADNLINFHKWEKWQKIPMLAKIVIFSRPNYSKKAFNSIALKKLKKNDWMYINEKKVNISSSLIRNF